MLRKLTIVFRFLIEIEIEIENETQLHELCRKCEIHHFFLHKFGNFSVSRVNWCKILKKKKYNLNFESKYRQRIDKH